MDAIHRSAAEALDAADPLAPFRDRFVLGDPEDIYLDGNSLGRLPRAAAARLREVVEHEWGEGLVESWEHWIDLPLRAGDALAEHVLGARPGEVAVCDSTTVNLYKLVSAALDARPGRRTLVGLAGDFPTDRYVLDGLAAARSLDVRLVPADPVEGVDARTVAAALDASVAAVVCSHVDYRSGAVADLPAVTAAARAAGALVVWDLSHSAGALAVELDRSGADLAVGCTYKYLNAGPGAPAFLYVRRELQHSLRSPIPGWFGQRDQFAMGDRYAPAPGVRRFLAGTPPVPAVALVEVGAGLVGEAGVGRLRAKSEAQTALAVALHDAWLAPLGFTLATPRDPARRGSHVALRHPEAAAIAVALRRAARVVPDFRAPDVIRLGVAPLYTRYVDVWDGLDRLRRLVAGGGHERAAPGPRVP